MTKKCTVHGLWGLLGVALAALGATPAAPAWAAPANVGAPASDDPHAAPVGAASAPAQANPDLERLRAEYDRIRDALFRARVRAQTVEGTLYAARLGATLRWKGRPDFVLTKARLLLDGAELWDSGDRQDTDDLVKVAERPVKPGPHALTVRLEVHPRAERKGGAKVGAERLGYTAEHTFAILIPDNQRTLAAITADESGDPPSYEPAMRLELETEK